MTTWERFVGNTDTFAVRIAFMPDPDGGIGAEPEETASWGAFQLWAGGRNLCAHVDHGVPLQSSCWYLLPLLEWLVENWDALLHEENPSSEGYHWWTHHALCAARSGGLLPDVIFRRVRDLIEVSWDNEPVAGDLTGVRYNASCGVFLVDAEVVARTLYESINAAVDYLTKADIRGDRIPALRQQIDNLVTRS